MYRTSGKGRQSSPPIVVSSYAPSHWRMVEFLSPLSIGLPSLCKAVLAVWLYGSFGVLALAGAKRWGDECAVPSSMFVVPSAPMLYRATAHCPVVRHPRMPFISIEMTHLPPWYVESDAVVRRRKAQQKGEIVVRNISTCAFSV